MNRPTQIQIALKSLREKMGLSQRGLADRIGMAGNAVQRWETGTTQPTTEALVKLYFLARDNDPGGSAGVFALGGAPPTASRAGSDVAVNDLTHVRDAFAKINLNLTRAISDRTLANEDRGACIGAALTAAMDGHEILNRAIQKLLRPVDSSD